MSVQKNIFILLAMACALNAKNWEFDIGTGPVWLNLRWITQYNGASDNTPIESVYKINKAVGYEIDSLLIYKSEEFKWLLPTLEFTYYNFRKGNGFSDTFTIENGKKATTLEFLEFRPSITAKSVTLSDEIGFWEKEYCDKNLGLSVSLGYNYSKFLLSSIYSIRTDKSISSSNSFSASLKFSVEDKNKNSITLQDYVYLTKTKTKSGPDSLIGIDAGTAYYNLVGNNLVLYGIYKILENLSICACFNWSYYHNFGKANILLSKHDKKLLKNPKLCVSDLNSVGFLLYLNLYF